MEKRTESHSSRGWSALQKSLELCHILASTRQIIRLIIICSCILSLQIVSSSHLPTVKEVLHWFSLWSVTQWKIVACLIIVGSKQTSGCTCANKSNVSKLIARFLRLHGNSLVPCNRPSRVKLHTSRPTSQETDAPFWLDTCMVFEPLITVSPSSL